jgi:small subunit ribosomal protein S10
MFSFNLIIKSHDSTFLNSFITKLKKNSFYFEDLVIVPLPYRRNLYTVLRSPHIDKKARDQFEMRVYTKKIKIVLKKDLNFLFFFLDFLKDNLSGISCTLD